MEPRYTTTAVSSGDGRNGRVALADESLDFILAAPPELRGQGDGANPEQLFALGYAASFHSALKAVGSRINRPVEGSIVTATVTLGRSEAGYAIAVGLIVSIPDVSVATARELIEAAHEICPYSKATRGNIDVTLDVG